MPKILTKEQERILKHIVGLKRNSQNTIAIGNQMDTYPLNIEDKELIQILKDLDANGLIHFKMNGTHKRDLYVAADVEILPAADTYFKEMKIEKKKDRRDWIRTYIPNILSIIAIIISVLSLIVSIYSYKLQLLQ